MKNKAEMNPEEGDSFPEVAQRWHENRKSARDPAHAERVWSRLERDVFPLLGEKLMHEITPPDVLEMVRKIEARGALDISRRAKQGVGQIFQFAIACGLASTDPTAHLRGALKPCPRVKHMSRLPLTELPKFLEKLRGYQEEGDRRSSITRDLRANVTRRSSSRTTSAALADVAVDLCGKSFLPVSYGWRGLVSERGAWGE